MTEKELDMGFEDEEESLDEFDNLDLDADFGGDSRPPMEKHSDLLKQLTNFQKFIKEKVNGWLGLRWDEEKKTYVRDQHIRPIMNRKCAAWCIDFLKVYTRDNNIITNIGRREYESIIEDIIDVVWLDIGTRTDYFGIRDDADLHRVCVELQHAVELVLMGAGDGKYTKFLSESTQRSENIQYQGMPHPGYMPPTPERRKKGMLGKIKAGIFGGG